MGAVDVLNLIEVGVRNLMGAVVAEPVEAEVVFNLIGTAVVLNLTGQ
jgi:hypothetical protein